MSKVQLRQAIVIVWLILSSCGMVTLLIAQLVPSQTIMQMSAYCRSHHDDCPFCGMTRGFVLIADGNLEAAASVNRGALPLYVMLLANASLATCYVCWSIFKWIPRRLKVVDRSSVITFKAEQSHCLADPTQK